MRDLADFMIASQYISLVLCPVAAIVATVIYSRIKLKSLLLLAVGVWLSTLAFYSYTFPVWESFGELSSKGTSYTESGWTDLTFFLASFGVLGEYLRLIAIVWLGLDIASGKLTKQSNKTLKAGTAENAAP